LDLQVTQQRENYIGFVVYNSDKDINNDLFYEGHIDYGQERTNLYFDKTEKLYVVPPFVFTYEFQDDIIRLTHVNEYVTRTYEYTEFNGYNTFIKTYYLSVPSKNYVNSNKEEKTKINKFKNALIVEGRPNTYKMVTTKYGYRIENYVTDGYRKEVPYTEEWELSIIQTGVDHMVLDYMKVDL